MRTNLLVVILYLCFLQFSYSQESDGVVAFALPIRNSLTFNRQLINPTFSFVREQHKFISFSNKREWVQFNDAPTSYFASYSGRFTENIGAGVTAFQQDYGVLTTFGGVLNFAYNVRLNRDSNLTFGLNTAAYSSGVNQSKVVTNFDDPSLQNVPSNLMLTVNPGINYGNTFIDLGVSVNNLVLYNVETSSQVKEDNLQGIQVHAMYTGYMASRGFFDEAKFSGLIRSEFREDTTILAGLAMVTIPSGIWAQVGYNSLYGASGGIGLNITKTIALEYNYERAIGELSNFGPSHELTLAYRFENKERYYYSGDDEVAGLISTTKKRRPKSRNRSTSRVANTNTKPAEVTTVTDVDTQKIEADKAAKLKQQNEQEEAAKLAQLQKEQEAKEQAETQAKLKAEQEAKAKEIAAKRAELEAQQKAKAAAERQARLQQEQEAKALAEAEQRAKAVAAEKAEQERIAQAAEKEALLKAQQKATADSLAQIAKAEQLKAEQDLMANPKNELGKTMNSLVKTVEESNEVQADLLAQFNEVINVKDQDLKDLKEENDLSEKGITVAPRPFKSITAENNALNALKTDLDNIIASRSDDIKSLEELYEDMTESDTLTNGLVLLQYKNTIKRLTSEQASAIETRTQLESRLESINVATEFERRRRIKRAAYKNEDDRYAQDRAALNYILN
ncbi:MAG: PorP/SprF family type IX secretion system membrane protein, partial [Winogradskyella sp.]|nr:PorP/SprF family type IX secretion system membrane protein [Winogradskyella sp.]